MSIDIEIETLIPFLAARTAFPGNKRPVLATLHRWRLRGVRGVRLETCLIGGTRYTSAEAIRRFIEAQNATDEPDDAAIVQQRRELTIDAADAKLKAALAPKPRRRSLVGAGC
jgi:uncharacterized protein DUF1580